MSLPAIARRLPIAAAAISVLFVAMWGGLLRIGWTWSPGPVASIVYHGPLMVGGFLGTLISMERAIAVRRWWPYAAPIASASGAILLLSGFDARAAQWIMIAASLVLVAVSVQIARRQFTLFNVVIGLGAVAWMAGNVVWHREQLVPAAVPWWIAFPLLTIIGERLELSRLLPDTRWRRPSFYAASATYLAGVVIGIWLAGLGWGIAGLGMLALAAWLFVYDLARRTIRFTGLPRFTATCLLSGYFFLAMGGILSIVYGVIVPAIHLAGWSWMDYPPSAPLAYDAILHALFLGFVFSMVFGHMPIIFPAVMQVAIDFRKRFYVHLFVLEVSVALRIVCDIFFWPEGRRWAGLLNTIAIAMFLSNTLSAARRRESSTGSLEGRSLIRLVEPEMKVGGMERQEPHSSDEEWSS